MRGLSYGFLLESTPLSTPTIPSLVIAVLVDNFQMALLKGLEKEKQEVLSGGGGQVDLRGGGTMKGWAQRLGEGRRVLQERADREGTRAGHEPLLPRGPPGSMRSYWTTH